MHRMDSTGSVLHRSNILRGYNIATSHGITLDQFYTYNPAVENNCSGLRWNYYVCVGK